jgi:hypothetical protein
MTTADRKKRMLEALTKSLGIVTTAVRKAGINRSTHYDWLENDPEYAAQVREIQDMELDMVESQLHGLIMNGNTAAIIFYLKTKGKERGYIERIESVNTNSQIDEIKVEIVKPKRSKMKVIQPNTENAN